MCITSLGSGVTRVATSWWKQHAIYQVYVHSFCDSNGDGIGDLRGVLAKLPYLQDTLGVQVLWLNPIYPSPWIDGGYDITNYCDVAEVYGGLEALRALLDECHNRGMYLILDFVPNHTSELHPWFIESRADRTNPKSDWYVWHDAKPDGTPPNNWVSYFGKSAWEWDDERRQYYLHLFAKEQPDLNWRNPDVVSAMLDVLRFWLDFGIDGFRVDVAYTLYKDSGFRDDTPNPDWHKDMPSANMTLRDNSEGLPEVVTILRQMRALVNSYPGDRMLLGEMSHSFSPSKLALYYGNQNDGLNLVFNFGLISRAFAAESISRYVQDCEDAMPGWAWPTWVLGNHDQVRLATRLGPDKARLAMMLLLTLRGTPVIYYGEELGMLHVNLPKDRWQDPMGTNEPEVALSREGARTPMCWSDCEHAGFSSVAPWLPLGEDVQVCNVETSLARANSMLNLTSALLALRQEKYALVKGAFLRLGCSAPDTFCYARYSKVGSTEEVIGSQTPGPCEPVVVLLNFANERQRLSIDLRQLFSEISGGTIADSILQQMLSTNGSTPCEQVGLSSIGTCEVELGPNEGRVLVVSAMTKAC